jgi:7-cyano-7-deazaguanine synthase
MSVVRPVIFSIRVKSQIRTKSKMKALILLSGGLDSAANIAFALERGELPEDLLAVTINYGQRAFESEKKAATDLCKYYRIALEILELPWLGQLKQSALTDRSRDIPQVPLCDLENTVVTQQSAQAVWVPNRNGVFVNVAAAIAEARGAQRVLVGFNKEEAATFPDNSTAFMTAINKALFYSTANGVRVESYTDTLDKTEIVARLRSLAIAFPFEKVWSCYLSGDSICGTCESCRRFLRAQGEKV